MSVDTSGGHADVTVSPVRVTAELPQRANSALSHHWFPTKGFVVDYLQHNGRCVHLLFGEKLEGSFFCYYI